MHEDDGTEFDRLISEKGIDSNPITLLSTNNAKPAQSEDEFEIQRRSFFGIKGDAGLSTVFRN